MRVSEKIYGGIFSVAISLVMSLAMSFFMLVVNVGFIEGFFWAWMKGFGIGFIVSLPVASFAVPIIQKILHRYLEIIEVIH